MARGALLIAAFVPIGCASLLSYDDYHARDAEVANGGPAIADDAVEDVVTEAAPGEMGIRPPPRPPGEIAPSGKGRTTWFIVNHFFLNQKPLGGSGTEQPWRHIGYDLDGQCTTSASLNTCKRVEGAASDTLVDGDKCRDNNFGSQIVPLVTALDANYEDTSNDAIKKGATTWMMVLEDLDDGPDDPFVSARLYKVASGGEFVGLEAPKFDGTDQRDVDNQSVHDNDISRPKTAFPRGYLAGNVFVSGDPSSFGITIPIQTVSVPIPVIGGVLTMRLNEAHTLGEMGVIAGAVRSTDVEGVLQPIAEQAGICPGAPLYTNFVRSIQRIMDVVADAPSMHDPTVTCDAFSLGFGFTAVPVLPPFRAVPPYPGTSRCSADAGTSDADSMTDVGADE